MKRTLALTATALTLTLTLAACGGEADDTQNAAAIQQDAGSGSGAGRGARMGQPGSGKVAAVDGSTAQVQSADRQTAVTWTDSTTFTQQVAASSSDVTPGACVVVTGTGSDDSGDAVTAASVRISEAVDGECTGGIGGGGLPGGRGGGRPTDLPSDVPSEAPDGQMPGGGRPEGRGGFAVGTVTAVSADGFTVASVAMGGPGDEESDAAETTDVSVTVSADTIYTTQVSASAADVRVGVCVTTRGETDSTGAVSATSIAISQAVDGGCETGFGGFPGGGRGGAQEEDQ